MATAKTATDWQGMPIPEGETDETVIKVWEVTPHPDGHYTHAVIRSWQQVNDFMCRVPEMYLDGVSEDECREGVTLTIKLRQMSLGEYREIEARED